MRLFINSTLLSLLLLAGCSKGCDNCCKERADIVIHAQSGKLSNTELNLYGTDQFVLFRNTDPNGKFRHEELQSLLAGWSSTFATPPAVTITGVDSSGKYVEWAVVIEKIEKAGDHLTCQIQPLNSSKVSELDHLVAFIDY